MTDRRSLETASDDFPIVPPWRDREASDSAAVERFRDVLRTRPETFQDGDTLGDYVLADQLGSGAMGTVYRGYRSGTEQAVAIKVLNASFVRQEDALRRFRKEARLLSEVRSPYITQLIDVCEQGDHQFIVTELVEGDTVAALLKAQTRLDEATAISIAAEVTEALVDISHLNIIHRDIKPDNILLAQAKAEGACQFTAKVTDFGLARHTEQSGSMAMTRDNSVLGTPLYMSPEQFGDASSLDARSDIYSLGATLFQMLTGVPPFDSGDILRLAEMHRHVPAPDARSRERSVSEAASEIVAKCLQKRADLRYQSAAELLADLRRLQRGEATSVAVHPLLPSANPTAVQTFRFEWELVSSPAELWPYVSNTERLNRAIGLPPVRYTTSVNDNDAVETFANVRIAGIPMRWQEHVFEWIEERRMGILREFEKGPLKWFTSVVEFYPTVDGQTRLVHTLKTEGRGWFGNAFAKFKLGFETRRSLSKVYHHIDGVLAETHGADPLIDAFEPSKRISASGQRQLDELVAKLLQQKVSRDALLRVSEFLSVAAAQDVARIRAIALAQRLNARVDDVVSVLLHGARIGMLELAWDIICPSCRIASKTYDLLSMVRDHEHCEACNVGFEIDLATQVEAIFRVHPQIRKSDTGNYCIGGPAHSPHIVAQTRLAPRESLSLGLALADGTYCIRGPQLPHSLTFRVQTATPTVDRTVNMEDYVPPPQAMIHLHLADGDAWKRTDLRMTATQQIIALHNDFDREVVVRVERTTAVTEALTVARLTGIPLFRELFPHQLLSPAQLATLTHVVLLQTSTTSPAELTQRLSESVARQLMQQHLQRLNDHVAEHGGTWIKIVGTGALAAFVNTEDAMRCAEAIQTTGPTHETVSAWKVTVAITAGEVTVTSLNGQLDYLGRPVDQLTDLLANAESGTVVGV